MLAPPHAHHNSSGPRFPWPQAPFHLSRLQAWGHTLVRLLITWESLAHRGPNPDTDIDEEYLAYLVDLITLMDEHGIRVIICAHQDVWSRFSGGSGAPGWTFEKAGLDIEGFKATGAAFVHNLFGEEGNTDSKRKEPVGAFVWPSGYQKMAAATMATLFWAGNLYAWQLALPHYDSASEQKTLSIQEYLQGSYIETFGRLIDRVGHLDAVIGVDLINEPHRGYVGLSDWHAWCYETDLHIGHFPSALQSLALGSGYRQNIPFYVKSWPWPTRRTHYSTVDPLGKSAWLSDAGMKQCVWRAHGAWQWDERKKQPVVLADDFFARDPRPDMGKRRIEWYRDCYAPFIQKFIQRLRQRHRHILCFLEPIPNEFMPPWSSTDIMSRLSDAERMHLMNASYDQRYATKTFIDTERPAGLVYAPHFYDLNVLFGKTHGLMSVNVQGLSRGLPVYLALFLGAEGLKKNYEKQIATLVEHGRTSLGAVPTVIGEVGIPFDINNGDALQTGDYAKHIELYDALIEAMEKSQVAFTLWNYNPDNSVAHGDGWNKEDFSVVCNDSAALDAHNDAVARGMSPDSAEDSTSDSNAKWDMDALHLGGRALTAIIRPYAVKVAGFPLSSSWDREKRTFEFHYTNPPPGFRESALNDAAGITIGIERGGEASTGTETSLSGTNEMSGKDATSEAITSEEARTTYIYVPRYHFEGCKLRVQLKDGTYNYDPVGQTLTVRHGIDTPGYTHIVRLIASETLPASQMTPEQHALVGRRQRNAQRRRGRIPLSVQDVCALLGVLLAFAIAMAVAYVGAMMVEARTDMMKGRGPAPGQPGGAPWLPRRRPRPDSLLHSVEPQEGLGDASSR